MTRRKGKPVSFDAMVKFFFHQYGIPTKNDIEKVLERLDRLEKVVREVASSGKAAKSIGSPAGGRGGSASIASASEVVLEVISRSDHPICLTEIKEKTGFGDKKLRNIIFRLHKTGAISRENRGRYTASLT